MKKQDQKIVIIGTGISGLSTGYWMQKAGYQITFLERKDQAGGSMLTVRKEGLTIDFGPNSGLDSSPYFHPILEDIDAVENVIYASGMAKNRYILKNHRLVKMPMGPLSLLSTPLFNIRGKLAIFREPWVKRGDAPESVAGFVERRFGREFLDYAINPFISGIYAGDPEHLSVREALPKLYALEEKYGSVIRGAIQGRKERKNRAEKAKIASRMFSFSGGMQAMAASIEGHLRKKGAEFLYQRDVTDLEKTKGGYKIKFSHTGKGKKIQESLETGQIILSLPAGPASGILKKLDPDFAGILSGIEYPPVLVLYLVFHGKDIASGEDGFGFLIPEVEKASFLGAIYSSTLFPQTLADHSEKNLRSFTVFIGGARTPLPNLDKDPAMRKKVEETTIGELQKIIHTKNPPMFQESHFWPSAIPQYNMGYDMVIRARENFEKNLPGLYIRANYVDGISLSDCLTAGYKKAEEIIQILNGKRK